MHERPLLQIRQSVACGRRLDVWLSATDVKSVLTWSAVLLPIYAGLLLVILASILSGGGGG